MVRRKKDQPPRKNRSVRMSDAEWAEMQRCAEELDESDSEFIRIAVKMRIANEDDRAKTVGKYEPVRTHKNNTVSKSFSEQLQGKSMRQNIEQMEKQPKSTMVNPLAKNGGKK